MLSRVTNKDSWEEAQVAFPQFASDERLKSFTGLIKGLRPGVPQLFREYCLTALGHAEGREGGFTKSVTKGGCQCLFIQGAADAITRKDVKHLLPSFQGAALVVAVCNTEVSLMHNLVCM